jgi:hypothetical protein
VIECYARGCEDDPRDPYPGINAMTLLFVEGSDESVERARDIRTVVVMALARRGGLESGDYWDLASSLEVAISSGDEDLALKALRRALVTDPAPWMVETTLNSLTLYRAVPDVADEEWYAAALSELRGA